MPSEAASQLFRWVAESAHLSGVLADGNIPDDCAAIVSSPSECFFAKLINGQLTDSSGRHVEIAQVYEAIFFHSDWEISWKSAGGASGTAVMLSERAHNLNTFWGIPFLLPVRIIEDPLILWGERWNDESLAGGWGAIAASRVGRIDLPFSRLTKDQRLAIMRRCYFKSGPDGNLVLVATRLNRFCPFSLPKQIG